MTIPGLPRASQGFPDRRARPQTGPKVTKVIKVVILSQKQAYLQAGIGLPGLPEASLGEIGHFCSLLDQNITRIVTFVTFGTTFARFWSFLGFLGFPRPDSSLIPGLPGLPEARFQASRLPREALSGPIPGFQASQGGYPGPIPGFHETPAGSPAG